MWYVEGLGSLCKDFDFLNFNNIVHGAVAEFDKKGELHFLPGK